MSLGFLFDEHVPPFLLRQLKRRAVNTRVFIVGDENSLPQGTPDPDILLWIEANHCLLVTNNRATMPRHLADHIAAGRHVPGIVQLPYPFEIGAILEDLMLILGAAQPEELQDQIIYLPLR